MCWRALFCGRMLLLLLLLIGVIKIIIGFYFGFETSNELLLLRSHKLGLLKRREKFLVVFFHRSRLLDLAGHFLQLPIQ